MKTLPLLVLFVAAAGTLAAAQPSNAEAGPAVQLPTYRVDDYSSRLGFAWKATLNSNDTVQTLRFSRVEERGLALRAGLQVDDTVVAINGTPVRNLPVSELQKLFYRDWKPGDTLSWDFAIERGAIVPRRETITLRLRTLAPAQATAAAPADPLPGK